MEIVTHRKGSIALLPRRAMIRETELSPKNIPNKTTLYPLHAEPPAAVAASQEKPRVLVVNVI